jgi:hypothetical protein
MTNELNDDQVQLSELPDEEETAEMLASVQALRERVGHYRSNAGAIDDEYRQKNEDRRYGLDDLPFGEEMIRTREFPTKLLIAERLLERIQDNTLEHQQIADNFERAGEILNEVESTLDDCTPLPPPEPNFDDEYFEDEEEDALEP